MKVSPPVHTAPPLSTLLSELFADAEGPVGVLESPRLARSLAQAGLSVISFSSQPSKAQSLESWSERQEMETTLRAVSCSPLELTAEPSSLGGLVAVGVFGGHRVEDVGAVVAGWRRFVKPAATLAVAELAGEGWAGRLLLRLSRKVRRRPTALDPADLCRHLLGAGVRPVSQLWPQGLGSWVFTHGRVAPLAHLKPHCAQVAAPAGTDPALSSEAQ